MGRMKDLKYEDFGIGQLVHDAVMGVDDLTEFIAVVFRDSSPHPRLVRDSGDKRSEPICDGLSRLPVVESDVVIDVGEILPRLRGPNQSSS